MLEQAGNDEDADLDPVVDKRSVTQLLEKSDAAPTVHRVRPSSSLCNIQLRCWSSNLQLLPRMMA